MERYTTEVEKKWLQKVNSLRDADWWREGVKVYKELLQSDPGNNRYKLKIAELLLELARAEKMRKFHYQDARCLFHEVLQQEPNLSLAHYHLGVLDINDRQWRRAIEHLTIYNESEDCIDDSRVKALCYLAVAYHHLDETDEAQELLEQAISLNRQWNNETIEFARFNLGLPPFETNKPYYMLSSDGEQRYLDDDEYEAFRKPVTGMIILNMVFEEPLFIGPTGEVNLGKKLAELLAALLSDQTVLTSEKLLDLSGANFNVSSMKTYIKRLRDCIRSCFKESIEDVIKTNIGSRYQWNWPCEFRIIRSNK